MGSPVWSCQGQIAVANAHKNKVKVTFSQGAHLPDPESVFNNGLGGKQWRALDLLEGDSVPEQSFLALIRAAIAFNREKAKKK